MRKGVLTAGNFLRHIGVVSTILTELFLFSIIMSAQEMPCVLTDAIVGELRQLVLDLRAPLNEGDAERRVAAFSPSVRMALYVAFGPYVSSF